MEGKKRARYRKWIFFAMVAVSYAAILAYNCLTPLMSDELQSDPSAYHSIADIIRAEYENYMTWNGRSVVQFIMRCFLLGPKWFFNICNSACFVLLTLLMYWNIRGERKQYDIAAYLLVMLLLWQFGVAFDQTVLWESGACNYLWGVTIILGFVTFFRYKTEHIDTVRHELLLTIGLFIFGMLAGWCNENTSGGGLLLVLFFAFVFYRSNKKIEPWMLAGIGGMLTGLVFMVLAPGNRYRGELRRETEEHSGILAYVGRFLKINKAVSAYLFLLLAVIVMILVFLVLKGVQIRELSCAILYVAVSIATAYALIFTVQPMDRAYFGAGVFMMIACVQAVWYIPREELYLSAIRYGGIIIFGIWMFFSYCENGADLMRIYREVNERERYILEQKAQGSLDLTVPMLRPEFQTRYSFMYKNDVDEDPEGWGCTLYREYYGLESLVGVPRSEWTEY